MKAITTKVLYATNCRPTRIKASAEGVPSLVLSRDSLENDLLALYLRVSEQTIHALAARKLCKLLSWPGDLASGGTDKCGVWVHCFVESVKPAPVSVNDRLAGALAAIFEHCAITHKHWGEGCNREQADAAVKAGKAALANYRTNQRLGVPDASDPKAEVSGYHLTLLETALENCKSPADPVISIKPLVEAARVLATASPYGPGGSLVVSSHAWHCFKAELDKVSI